MSSLGAIIFALCLFVSFAFVKPLEATAVDFLKGEITNQINSKIDALLGINSTDVNFAQKIFLHKYKNEVPILKRDLEILTNNIADCLSTDQSEAEKESDLIRIAATYPITSKLRDFEVVKSALGTFQGDIKQKYKQTWNSLIQDIRIFSIINLGSFLLVLLLTTLAKDTPRYLSFSTWVLLTSTFLSIAIYIYGQNWFYTILYDRYYGTGYLSMLICIFGYLLFRPSIDYVFSNINWGRRHNT